MGTKSDDREYILATEEVKNKEEAIAQKMKFIQPKLLGIPLVRYEIQKMRKVYIPYQFLIFRYEIPGKVGIKREGELAIIFDLNEVHPFHFDLAEDRLNIVELAKDNLEGTCLSEQCTEEEAIRRSTDLIQWKVLFRFYKRKGDLKLLVSQKFYRPAWELDLLSNNKQFIKYASLDFYGTTNEHLSGMKLRMES